MSLAKRLTWYSHRLRAMSPAEVAHRVGDRWRRRSLPAFLQEATALEAGPARQAVPRLPDPHTQPPELRARLQEDAHRLLRGEWSIFGTRTVEVGAPPCWHRDPACGVVIAPEESAQRLDHRHLPDGADARTIWEINRWAEMTRLAMHGWLNQDSSAIRTAQLWLEDWCDRNPPGQGINWTSPLEVALRLINFTWFDALVAAWAREESRQGATTHNHQSALVRRIVPVHAAWIWRHRSTGSSANNHLLGELAALVLACSRWPALEGPVCTVETAWEALGAEVLRQFGPDGGSLEQALHYHLFALDLAWQAARAVGCRAGPVFDRLMAAGAYFHALAQGGEAWDFGDNDDAQVVPATLCRHDAAAEWRQWLAGEEGALRFWFGPWPARVAPLPEAQWKAFPQGGMASAEAGGWRLRLDASPLGFGPLAAHGHGDALHLSLWDGPHALVIDPGTGGYYGHLELRQELAAWEAHNGPQPVSGFRTPRRVGPFLQVGHHPPPVLAVEGTTASARLQHEGWNFMRKVTWEAGVVGVEDREEGGRAFTVRWCFPPGSVVKAQPNAAKTAFRIGRGALVWLVEFDHATSCKVEERRVSPSYGQIEMAPVLVVEAAVGQGLNTRFLRLVKG